MLGGLNEQLEREIRIVALAPLSAVRHGFGRVGFWRVKISDAEVVAWTGVELAMIALTLAALLRLGAAENASAGTIYAVPTYVFTLFEPDCGLPRQFLFRRERDE